MTQDPILAAFADLVKRYPQAPLVASPSRAATVGEVSELARRIADTLRNLRPELRSRCDDAC